MKSTFVRSILLSVLILALPIVLALVTKKYIILIGLAAFFVSNWIGSAAAAKKASGHSDNGNTDKIVKIIGIFANLIYAASVIYGLISVIVK